MHQVYQYDPCILYHGTISNPRLRALPTTDRATLSSPSTFNSASAILIFAISYICLTETLPENPELPGVRLDNDGAACDPFSIPAHRRSRCETGGVRVVNVNVRSGLMVMVVGVGVVGFRCAVRALLRLHKSKSGYFSQAARMGTLSAYNSLQKSIAFTPRAPSAGPTGGDGVALPAGTRIFCRFDHVASQLYMVSFSSLDYLRPSALPSELPWTFSMVLLFDVTSPIVWLYRIASPSAES